MDIRSVSQILSSVEFGMDPSIRCHRITDHWFHATQPSVGEVMALGSSPTPASVIELADKHILLSQSSFEGASSLRDIPMYVFPEVVNELFSSSGDRVQRDNSCHLGDD